MANDFTRMSNNIQIQNYNFLPSIQIDLLDNSQSNANFMTSNMFSAFGSIDIWDGPINQVPHPKIDFKKFSRYL